MAKSGTLVDFEGVITFGTIEMLLNKLRATKEFQEMNKPCRKRLYSIFVESIDNIFKYAAKMPGNTDHIGKSTRIAVLKNRGSFLVSAGNMVLNEDVEDLKFKLDRVNQLNNEALKSLYEEVINQESSIHDTGAGLGLITMAMRTDSDIGYSFTAVDKDHSFFEIKTP